MKNFFLTAVTLAGLSSAAFGAQVSQIRTVGTTATDFDTAVTFNTFDPSFGTLLDIQFVLVGNTAATGTVTNNSGKARVVTLNSSVTVQFGNTGFQFDVTIPTASNAQTVANGASATISASQTGNATTLYNAAGVLQSYTGTFTTGAPDSPLNIAEFVNGGSNATFTENFSGTNNSGCSGGSLTCNTSATAGGTIQIIYDYTPPAPPSTTPEPATMALFGSALLGLGFAKFRKRS